MQDEYDDEEDEDEEEDAENDSEEQSDNSEDEAKENEELQHKLDRIKQNLKENSNSLQQLNYNDSTSYQNRDRTMQNLNDVLQRQRDRLENLYQQQPIVYDPAEGFQDSRNSPQSKQMNT